MPEMISFKVTQTCEIIVTANSLADAVVIAENVFASGRNDAALPWGHVTVSPKPISIVAERR